MKRLKSKLIKKQELEEEKRGISEAFEVASDKLRSAELQKRKESGAV